MHSRDAYKQSFGVPAAEGFGDFLRNGAADISPAWLARLETATVADPWIDGFAMVHVASNTVIGSASFKGPPDADGAVEVAYGVVPSQQGRGYATEATAALVSYAFADDRVRVVRAHTSPRNDASARVLTKCGFTRIGEVLDPDDGRGSWPRSRMFVGRVLQCPSNASDEHG